MHDQERPFTTGHGNGRPGFAGFPITSLALAWILPFAGLFHCAASPGLGAGILLVDHGRSDYVIALPPNAGLCENHAAQELETYIETISGARLPIVPDSGTAKAKEIRLTLTGSNQNSCPESFHILTQGDDLVIAGGSPRGMLYGVYALLEEQLGCRWLTPEVTSIPTRSTLRLPPLDLTEKPRFEYREPQRHGAQGESPAAIMADADWAAHNRVNSGWPLTDAQGGAIQFVPGYNNGTSAKLLPAETYFKDHPEYYALTNGKRQPTQLCLTNPEVQKIALDQVRLQLRTHPECGVISVSQNDGGGPCQCDDCQAVVDREGSQSGPILEFVNFVAAGIRDQFPNAAVETEAYYYTEKPPKSLKPLPNVIVRLCSYGYDSGHPLESSAPFRKNLEGWNKLTDRIWIWDYTVNYANFLQPFPNLLTLQPNAKYFAAHGVRGVYEEGDYVNGPADLDALRTYMLAKLLWNPDCDIDAVRNDFLTGYYGPAAPDMAQYVDLIHAPTRSPDMQVGLYDPPSAGYLKPNLLARAAALFDHAESILADKPDYLRRVESTRLGIDYVMLANWNPGAPNALPRKTITNISERFLNNANADRIVTVHESPRMSPRQFVDKVLARKEKS